MAVNLIRKNNGAGITAYQDAVLFHLAKGENGVIADVHDEFNATYDNSEKKITIASGMGIVYGRQFEITPSEVVQFDFSTFTGTRYIVIYMEFDLRDPSSEVAMLKSVYASSAYPIIDVGDNLIEIPNGISRYELYRILKTDSDATIIPVFTKLQNDKIKYSHFADESDEANNAKKINDIDLNTTDGKLTVKLPYSSQTEIIERKVLVFDGENSPYNYSGNGVWLGPNVSEDPGQGRRSIDVTEPINSGDVLEFIAGSGSDYFMVRAYVKGTQFKFCLSKNQSIGPYAIIYYFECDITNGGITIAPNANSIYLLNNPYSNISSGEPSKTSLHIWKIYKIIGETV